MNNVSIDIPTNWEIVKIPDVLFFQEGPGVRKWQFRDTGVKLLNVGNINDGKVNLDTTKIYISEEEANGKYSHFLINEGDLLIACSGIVVDNFHNKIAFVDKSNLPLCLNTSTMRFRELDAKRIDLNYYKYYLQTRHFTSQLRKLITGSAQLNFGPSHIRKINLLLPPLNEQKYIASILDKADTLRQKNRKILEEYDELAQSIFLEMFGDPVNNPKGWKFNEFKKSVLVMRDGPFGSNLKTIHYRNSGVRVIRLQNIGTNEFVDNDKAFISEEHYSTINKHTCLKGDVLIATLGKPNIRACRFPEYIDKAVNKADCIQVRPKNKILHDVYLVHLINSTAMLHWVKNMLHGQTRTRVSLGQLSKLYIPLPPFSLQNEFAQRIEHIEKQKELAKKSLKESEDLFQSLLQKAFKGELCKELSH